MQDQRAPRQEGGVHDEVLPEDVEQGQEEDQPVFGPVAGVMDGGPGVGDHVAVAQGRALGEAGRARRIEQDRRLRRLHVRRHRV